MKGKRIKLGGRQFVELRRSDLLPIIGDKVPDGDELVLFPHRPPDDHLEFPANAQLENAYFFVGSGLASHEVNREETTIVTGQYEEIGFSATDLNLFREDDWYGECFAVLNAHGWLEHGGGLSECILSKVVSICGEAEIRRAKRRYGKNWESYVKELAAVQFAKPLSRLWYAANMMSLYFAHYDDLRLGFLWAEYQIRMRHEVDSLRGKKSVVGAQSGGTEHAKMFEKSRREIIASMDAYVRKGKSASNAATLTFKAGLGTSPEANRKRWTRHRPK